MRVTFYIDGLNVYHALTSERRLHRYKWLNYAALARCYLMGRETLAGVKIYTALATWDQSKVRRHRDFLAVQEHFGAEVVLGRFKKRSRHCRECGREFETFEEKQTDVNIAVDLMRDAYLDRYDKAVLISGDTDIVPAIRATQDLFLDKKIGVVCPVGRSSKELKQVCDFHFQMKENQLARCVLPESVDCGRAGIIRRPESWR